MSEAYISPIQEDLRENPVTQAWLEAANSTLGKRREVIQLDTERDLDLTNPSDLALQLEWAQSAAQEKLARQELLLSMTDPEQDTLDALSKTALVASIQCLDTQSAPRSKTRIMRYGDRTALRVRGDIFHPPRVVKLPFDESPLAGAERVFWQADQIVDAVTTAQGMLGDGGTVHVHETHYWSELRTAHRAGNRVSFSSEVDWKLRVDDPGVSFPIVHPYISDNGNVVAPVPTTITGAHVEDVKGLTTRDFEYIGFEYDRTGLRFPDRANHKIANIPLPSVLLAAGENVYDYVGGHGMSIGLYPEKDTLSVTINGNPLPTPYPVTR